MAKSWPTSTPGTLTHKDMANISSKSKSPDLETERMNQGHGRSNGDSSRTKNRPHSVHFPLNGEQDSDKENQVAVRGQGGVAA